MIRGITILLSLFVIHNISGQSISSRFFTNTDWFSDNTDSLFYMSDTIKLVKYSNLIEKGKGYKLFEENGSLDKYQLVYFQFERFGKMHFWVQYYHMSSISKIGERTWKFNKQKTELTIFRNGEVEFVFKQISTKEIEFESRQEVFKTIAITMVKMEYDR